MNFLNRFDLDENFTPLEGGQYNFNYTQDSDKLLYFKGNGRTSLTLKLNGVIFKGGIKIEKCKSIIISISNSSIIKGLTIEDCTDSSGSIEFIDHLSLIEGNLNFISFKTYRFKLEGVRVKGNVEFINGSHHRIDDLKFVGFGSIGGDLCLQGGEVGDIIFNCLDIHGGLKIGGQTEFFGRLAYTGQVKGGKIQNFIKGDFKIEQSVKYNLKPNNISISNHHCLSEICFCLLL